MVKVVEFTPEYATAWKRFLEASNNGTLFHDIDFLAYHPPHRFNIRHLLFKQDEEIIALLPAAFVAESDGRQYLKSPYGASVGGFVLPRGLSVERTLALVTQLKDYVKSIGLDGIEIRIGPNIYMHEPNEHLSFALAANGFRLQRRWLSHVLMLSSDPAELVARFKPEKVRDMRAGLRKGIKTAEANANRLDDFYRLLIENKLKHGAKPTHSHEELEDLFRRIPSRIRLFLCEYEGQVLAGILVFVLNHFTACTFYICSDDQHAEFNATTVLLADVSSRLATEGLRSLDLGPTTFDDMSLNRGLAFFKEGFGARGFCRDAWIWENP